MDASKIVNRYLHRRIEELSATAALTVVEATIRSLADLHQGLRARVEAAKAGVATALEILGDLNVAVDEQEHADALNTGVREGASGYTGDIQKALQATLEFLNRGPKFVFDAPSSISVPMERPGQPAPRPDSGGTVTENPRHSVPPDAMRRQGGTKEDAPEAPQEPRTRAGLRPAPADARPDAEASAEPTGAQEPDEGKAPSPDA